MSIDVTEKRFESDIEPFFLSPKGGYTKLVSALSAQNNGQIRQNGKKLGRKGGCGSAEKVSTSNFSSYISLKISR